MAAAAAGAAVVGAGIGVYGALTSAAQQADIARKKATLEQGQANELAEREQVNEALRTQAGLQKSLNIGSAAAASGHEGTGIGSQLEIARQTTLANEISHRESDFQYSQLMAGVGMENQQANDIQQAGYWNAASALVGGVGKVAGGSGAAANPGGPQSLGSYSSPMNENFIPPSSDFMQGQKSLLGAW